MLCHSLNSKTCGVVPWPRRLFAGLSLRKPLFTSRRFHAGFVVERVACDSVFCRVLRFSCASIWSTIVLASPKVYNLSKASARKVTGLVPGGLFEIFR